MKTIGFGFVGLLLAAWAAADASGADKDKPAVYKTPEELHDAFEAAVKKGDHKTIIDCFAPTAQKNVATWPALFAIGQRQRAQEDKERKAKGKPAFDILDKYGLTEEATKKINGIVPPFSEAQRKAQRQLEPLIQKDPAGLYVELKTAFAKLKWSDGPKPHPDRVAKLTKVKINGDKATGVQVVTEGDDRYTVPREFVKIDGSWRLPPEPDDK